MITILYELCLLHPPSHTISLFRHQPNTEDSDWVCLGISCYFHAKTYIYGSCTGFPYPLAAGSDFFQVKWDPVYWPPSLSHCNVGESQVPSSSSVWYVFKQILLIHDSDMRRNNMSSLVSVPPNHIPSQVNSVQCKYSSPQIPKSGTN